VLIKLRVLHVWKDFCKVIVIFVLVIVRLDNMRILVLFNVIIVHFCGGIYVWSVIALNVRDVMEIMCCLMVLV
jgi:hypothetical protein